MTLDEVINALRAKYPDTMNKVDKLLEEYKAAKNEYIRRSDLLMAYDAQHKGKPGNARKLIAELPAADVRPVVRGEWIISNTFDDCVYARCDQCATTQIFYYGKPLTNFCPSCGADMRKRENNNG